MGKFRIAELEKSLDLERSAHANAMGNCQGEINRLREQMAVQLQEYQDLMDIRTALDMEIAAYHKLLEAEESRLNLTPSMSPTMGGGRSGTPGRLTPARAIKRKRTMLEESSAYTMSEFQTSSSSKRDVEIAEVDTEGGFIRLSNKANETETVYKFHRSLKIAPGATVTVYSAGSGATHEPPATLVMKEQRWFVADRMVTHLFNMDGDEMAVRDSFREKVSQSPLRQRGPEELHHQQGDP